MSAIVDLSGHVFGKLRVVERSGSSLRGRAQWLCECECGKETTVVGKRLRSGETKSCGCLRVDIAVEHGMNNKTHGQTKSRTWKSWSCMRERCMNPNAHGYSLYGARGIKICSRWDRFESFLVDMGERPDGFTIDRIDTDGNYEPGNCRWASWKQQNNNKRNNRRFNGKTAAEIADELGTNYVTTRKRLIRAEQAANVMVRPVGLPVAGQQELISMAAQVCKPGARNPVPSLMPSPIHGQG